MEKNITVIDTQGRAYETTWPKRARGLVKSGRARFVNENTICLTRPPQQTEDNHMFDNNMEEMNMQELSETKAQENADTDNAGTTTMDSAATAARIDESYIIRKLDQILGDSKYLTDSIAQLENADEAIACTIGNLVEAREHTNQAVIDLLRKMLENMRPQPVDPKLARLEALQNFLKTSELDENHKFDILNQAIQRNF